MKKYFIYVIMAFVAVTFNACGDDAPVQEGQSGTEQPEVPDDPDAPDIPAGNSKILVAYFSWVEPHSGWHSR